MLGVFRVGLTECRKSMYIYASSDTDSRSLKLMFFFSNNCVWFNFKAGVFFTMTLVLYDIQIL